MLSNEEHHSTHYLPENLRVLRKREGLSQEELASRVGLNRGNIASYEKGTAAPKLCNLIKFAWFFRISLTDLTARDLSNGHVPDTLFEAPENEPGNADSLQLLSREIVEFGKVIDSLQTCYQYNLRNLCEADRNSKEVQAMISHFEQLSEVSKSMLSAQQALFKIASRNSKG